MISGYRRSDYQCTEQRSSLITLLAEAFPLCFSALYCHSLRGFGRSRFGLVVSVPRKRPLQLFGIPVEHARDQNAVTSVTKPWPVTMVRPMVHFHHRKMSDWSSRDHVTSPNSKWRQYLHTLFIPVERRLIAA